MSAVENNSAIFRGTAPGKGSFTLVGFRNTSDFGNVNVDGLEICISKENRRLADWPGDSSNNYFIKISNIKSAKKGVDFYFEVGHAVVDPMAWDSAGSFILSIKGISGTIYRFAVDINGMPVASGAMRPDVEKRADNRTVYDQSESVAPKKIKVPEPKINSNLASENIKLNTASLNKNESKIDNSLNKSGANLASGLAGASAAPKAPEPANLNLGNFNSGVNNGPQIGDPHNQNTNKPINNAQYNNRANKGNSSIFIMKIVGIICVILLLIGAVFFVMNLMKGKAPVEPQETINQSCALDKAKGDDKTIITNCLASNPSIDDLNYLLADAMKQERCEIVLRILRTKGRTPEGSTYAYVYSQFADPNSSYQNKCITKSQDDATYWLERVKSNQSFNQAQADALLKTLQ